MPSLPRPPRRITKQYPWFPTPQLVSYQDTHHNSLTQTTNASPLRLRRRLRSKTASNHRRAPGSSVCVIRIVIIIISTLAHLVNAQAKCACKESTPDNASSTVSAAHVCCCCDASILTGRAWYSCACCEYAHNASHGSSFSARLH